LVREYFSVTFGKRMSKIVVSYPHDNVQKRSHFCYIRYDIRVIFAARQRNSLQVMATREKDIRYFVRRHCETLVIFTTIRDLLWNLFLISRLYCSIHFDLMAAVGQKSKPAVECRGCVLLYIS
jgi:hypothetical protein